MKVLHQARSRESGYETQAIDARNIKRKTRQFPTPGWYVRCVEHATTHPCATRSWAAYYMAHPTQWCDSCKKEGEAKRRGGGTPVRDQDDKLAKDRLAVYRTVFNEWAPTAAEVKSILGMPLEEVTHHLRSLRAHHLVEDHEVNGVPPAVWQTYYDVDNGGQWEDALADYEEAYA